MMNNGAGRKYWRLFPFFHSQLLKIEVAMAFSVMALQKTNSVQPRLFFKAKNQSKSLLGPYEVKLQWRFCRWGRSSAMAAVVLLEIEKSSSQVFSSLPYIVRMTWSHPNMPFPQRVWVIFGSLSPSKFGDEISSVADPRCLSRIADPGSKFFPSWIPDLNFFHPGLLIPDPNFFPSRIRIKECKCFNPKKMVSKLSEIWSRDLDPRSGS